jgi:polar amino acid transport system substrate-binding protein
MRQILLLGILLIAASIPEGAFGQTAISSEIAPAGKLRVATNAKFIAEKLGLPFELVPYPDSNTYTQSFGKGEWDIGFGARTPLVAEKADFVVDLLLNDYLFVAAPGREYADAAQVDQSGVKIGVGLNSASDQFLSRTLKSAELVRLGGGGRSIEALRTGQVDVWAASASNIEQVVDGLPGAKIIPGAFTSDRTMVILPKGRSSAAQAKVVEIVNEAKKTGVVQKALEKTGARGFGPRPEVRQ